MCSPGNRIDGGRVSPLTVSEVADGNARYLSPANNGYTIWTVELNPLNTTVGSMVFSHTSE